MKLKAEVKVILKHLEKCSRATQNKEDCKNFVKKGLHSALKHHLD